MVGFYRNKYTSPDGKETRYGASTQFEVIAKKYFSEKNKNTSLNDFSRLIVDEHFHVGMSPISKLHST